MSNGYTSTIGMGRTDPSGDSDMLPWLETLAASSVPRLADRKLAGILNSIQVTAQANGMEIYPRDEFTPNNALVMEDPGGKVYLVAVQDGSIEVQSWDKRTGRTQWAWFDTKRRPGAYLPPGSEVSA